MVAKEVGTGEMGEKGEGIKKFKLATSDQDGGIGRYTLPPSTTKRTTINLKTKNNQNFQKIKLYGNPTTMQLKKKYSFRLLGGAEMGSWGGREFLARWLEDLGARWQLADLVVPYLHADKLEEQLGSETYCIS